MSDLQTDALEALRTNERFFTTNPIEDTRPVGLVQFIRSVLVRADEQDARRKRHIEETYGAQPEAVKIAPENYWRDVWHIDCKSSETFHSSPMIHHDKFVVIEDGSKLYLFECAGCAAKVFGGLNKERRVVTRPFPTETELEHDN